WCGLRSRWMHGLDQDDSSDNQHYRSESCRASLDPATAGEPATVDQIASAAVGLAHVVRDCILELLSECFVTHTLRMTGGQHVPGPPRHAQYAPRRALKYFSDLSGGQSHVRREDDGNSLVVCEGPEVRDDWFSGGEGRGAMERAT